MLSGGSVSRGGGEEATRSSFWRLLFGEAVVRVFLSVTCSDVLIGFVTCGTFCWFVEKSSDMVCCFWAEDEVDVDERFRFFSESLLSSRRADVRFELCIETHCLCGVSSGDSRLCGVYLCYQ